MEESDINIEPGMIDRTIISLQFAYKETTLEEITITAQINLLIY